MAQPGALLSKNLRSEPADPDELELQIAELARRAKPGRFDQDRSIDIMLLDYIEAAVLSLALLVGLRIRIVVEERFLVTTLCAFLGAERILEP